MARNEILEMANLIEKLCDDLGEKKGRGNLAETPSLRFYLCLGNRMERIIEWMSGSRSPAYGAHLRERYELLEALASDDEDTEKRDENDCVIEPAPAWKCREHGRRLALALRTQADDMPEDKAVTYPAKISLCEDDRLIIAALRNRRIKIADLAATIERDRGTVSVKLKKLRDLGLVDWPEGSRGGAALTKIGGDLTSDSTYFPH